MPRIYRNNINYSGVTFLAGSGITAGIITPYAGDTAPTGWLLCDGSAVSRTTYSVLFDTIGTTYGSGDGSTTFNVPDLRGAFPVGADSSIDVGDTGGEKNHTLTVNEIPAHQHETNITAGGTGGSTNAGYVSWTSGRQSNMYQASTITQAGSHTPITTDQPHNNMPPYTGVNYIISIGSQNGGFTHLKYDSQSDTYNGGIEDEYLLTDDAITELETWLNS